MDSWQKCKYRGSRYLFNENEWEAPDPLGTFSNILRHCRYRFDSCRCSKSKNIEDENKVRKSAHVSKSKVGLFKVEIKNQSVIIECIKVAQDAVCSEIIISRGLEGASIFAVEPKSIGQQGARVSTDIAVSPEASTGDEQRARIQIISSSPFLLINYKESQIEV